MNLIKRGVLGALTAPGVRSAMGPFRKGTGTILMLHRFTDLESGAVGHDPEEVRQTLAFLRRRGYELVELTEMFRRLREGDQSGDFGVSITLDDGYGDQVRVAGPIFAEFDCPATVFVTTGFLDQTLWQWWDRIEFVFDACRRRQITTTLAGESLAYSWEKDEGSAVSRDDFTERCKLVPDQDKLAAILRLAEAAEVELPAGPPEKYAPMSWSELRTWEERGMTFGPHTVTHPILSRTGDEQSRQEISDSWSRLSAMARRPTPIFCYPNGQRGDFGPREFATLQSIGLQGAVVGVGGYAEVSEFRESPANAFKVRRFGYPGSHRIVAQFVSGLERIRYGTGRPT